MYCFGNSRYTLANDEFLQLLSHILKTFYLSYFVPKIQHFCLVIFYLVPPVPPYYSILSPSLPPCLPHSFPASLPASLPPPDPCPCLEFTVPGRPQSDVSPVKCVEGEPAGWYNNGYPMLCGEGETCDAAVAEAGTGNPCRAAAEK